MNRRPLAYETSELTELLHPAISSVPRYAAKVTDTPTDIHNQLTHIVEDLHDLSRRFAAVETKIKEWELRAEPLLKLRESARRMATLGKGRNA